MEHEQNQPRPELPRDPENEQALSERLDFLIGEWEAIVRSSLVRTGPLGKGRVTGQVSATVASGPVTYKDITFGGHVHGQYLFPAEGEPEQFAVLIQRPAAPGDRLAVTAAN